MYNFKIAILILHYKNWTDTNDCVASCLKNLPKNYTIIVIDNDEKKNNQSLYPNIKIINTPTNLGFAGGLNCGINEVYDEYDYFLCLNNDLTLDEKSLDSFNAMIKREIVQKGRKIAVLNSPLYDTNNKSKVQAIYGQYNTWTGTTSHINNFSSWLNYSGTENYLVGANLLLNKSYLDKNGLLPDQYFLYYEELELCKEIKKCGWEIEIDIDNKMYHKEHGSVGLKSPIHHFYTTRNTLKYALKNNKLKFVFVLGYVCTLYLIGKLFKMRFEELKSSFAGFQAFVMNKEGKWKI